MDTSVPADTVVQVGRNAWRSRRAERLTFLVDGAEYFEKLDWVLRQAQRSIRIVGWDLNPQIRLRPGDSGERLGVLLRGLVETRPELRIEILVWSMGPIYSSHTFDLYRHHDWADHPRIALRFDKRHALRGSHHQKLVSVDDHIAFVGGIDLTMARWDTSDHACRNPLRKTPDGKLYGPVHDVQVMVSGEPARAVAELIRLRWRRATGDELIELETSDHAQWPAKLLPDMEDCTVALARTMPGLSGLNRRREAIRLTNDAIAFARKHIYIETQYLASFNVSRSLERRLREPDGPEVVIVVTSESRGLLEQVIMAHNRDRLIRRLMRADHGNRLRVMFAVVPDENGGEAEVLIHSKVLVIDDRFARVGSSNLNNRSEGLDTECDLAVIATDATQRRAIAVFRNRLLAEHLDVAPEQLAVTMKAHGSMVAAIDKLNVSARGLRPFPVEAGHGRTSPLPGTRLLDPKGPMRPFHAARRGVAAALSRVGSAFF